VSCATLHILNRASDTRGRGGLLRAISNVLSPLIQKVADVMVCIPRRYSAQDKKHSKGMVQTLVVHKVENVHGGRMGKFRTELENDGVVVKPENLGRTANISIVRVQFHKQ
jgi:hypothetical protein